MNTMILSFVCEQCTLRQFARLDKVSDWEQAHSLLPEPRCMRCMMPMTPTNGPVAQSLKREPESMVIMLAETGALARVPKHPVHHPWENLPKAV